MAHKRDYKPEDIAFPNQVITESELVGEMQRSYIDYAMSVIVGRALPDVRDGLKPVHRRILYTMYESGLSSDKPFKTSATCVGNTAGEVHCEQCHQAEEVPPAQTFLCQRVGHQDCHDHGKKGINYCDDDRKYKGADHAAVCKNSLVCCRFKFNRPEAHNSPQDRALGAERNRCYVYKGQQAGKAENQDNDCQDNLMPGPDFFFLHNDFMLVRGNDFFSHFIRLPYQMPSSPRRLATKLALVIRIRPTTDWNSPTAAAFSNL